MSLGGLLAAASFIICGLIQLRVNVRVNLKNQILYYFANLFTVPGFLFFDLQS
jgi:hypothetical protein